MFKEVHKSPKDVDFTRKGTPPCAVCKNLSKTPLYVCETSSITCENCQKAVEKKQDRGDSTLTTNKGHSSIKCNLDIRRINSESACSHVQDLAGGDHDIRIKASKSKRKSKSDHKIRTVYENYDLLGIGKCKDICKKHELEQDTETVIRYHNVHFNTSNWNTSNLTTFENTSDLINADDNYQPNYITFPRPVICPVSDCGKIIAIESIIHHFCFDHSKVPRIMLDRSVAQQVLLKACNVTMKTQCLAVYLLQNNQGPVHRTDDSNTILNGSNNNQNTLLLIGVRMKMDGTHRTKMSSSRYTQTGTDFQDFQGKRKETQLVDVNRKEFSYNTKENRRFENNEILLLWICKLNNSAINYSITISTEDKKKGHSFIGEAIHIKDQQDSITMYQRSECLITHGNAVNRLLDDQNQFIVFVNVIE